MKTGFLGGIGIFRKKNTHFFLLNTLTIKVTKIQLNKILHSILIKITDTELQKVTQHLCLHFISK